MAVLQDHFLQHHHETPFAFTIKRQAVLTIEQLKSRRGVQVCFTFVDLVKCHGEKDREPFHIMRKFPGLYLSGREKECCIGFYLIGNEVDGIRATAFRNKEDEVAVMPVRFAGESMLNNIVFQKLDIEGARPGFFGMGNFRLIYCHSVR